jgi:nitrogen regulatory protein P-II 1
MKLIRSVIHPDKIEQVREALKKMEVSWLTVTQVSDHNPSKTHTMSWRGRRFDVGAIRMEIDVAVPDDDVDLVVDTIIKSARTGEMDDGYISVIPVEGRYEIRTGRRAVS